MKTENRSYHKYGKPDEYGIEECEICHSLRKRKAFGVHGQKVKQYKGKWEMWYSKNGIKWSVDYIHCN